MTFSYKREIPRLAASKTEASSICAVVAKVSHLISPPSQGRLGGDGAQRKTRFIAGDGEIHTANAGLRVCERQTIHPSTSASSHVEISGSYVTSAGLRCMRSVIFPEIKTIGNPGSPASLP